MIQHCGFNDPSAHTHSPPTGEQLHRSASTVLCFMSTLSFRFLSVSCCVYTPTLRLQDHSPSDSCCCNVMAFDTRDNAADMPDMWRGSEAGDPARWETLRPLVYKFVQSLPQKRFKKKVQSRITLVIWLCDTAEKCSNLVESAFEAVALIIGYLPRSPKYSNQCELLHTKICSPYKACAFSGFSLKKAIQWCLQEFSLHSLLSAEINERDRPVIHP